MLRKITIIGIWFYLRLPLPMRRKMIRRPPYNWWKKPQLFTRPREGGNLKRDLHAERTVRQRRNLRLAYDSTDCCGTSQNPKLIGKNLVGVPDADGKLFRKDIVEMAKAKGTGWVAYKYKNPKENKVEKKTTYLQKVGEVVLCCGVMNREFLPLRIGYIAY